jgi:hypothetical protein
MHAASGCARQQGPRRGPSSYAGSTTPVLCQGLQIVLGHLADRHLPLPDLQPRTSSASAFRSWISLRNLLILLAHPTRFERVTFAFGGQHSS